MATRYNPSTKSLDLSQFHACSVFTNNQLFVPLNQPAVLLVAINMVAQHTKHDLYGLSLENNHIYLDEGLVWIRRLFPELKVLDFAGNKFSDLKDLRCLSGYTIRELNLSRNPMSNTEDKERYKRYAHFYASDLTPLTIYSYYLCSRNVQKYFPMLNKLDNAELLSRYSAAIIGSKFKMPINLGNSYPIPEGHNPELPNPIMTLVESFLNLYYILYDNQVSRQTLSEAYHINATFTLSSCFLFKKVPNSLSKYLPESRNFLKSDQNRHGRRQFLHKGKEDIINFLDKLPNTKHDFGSFIVDVPLATAAMVQIVVNGVFAENFKITNYRNIYRSFCRTFCIVPVGSGWNIISDMLFVTIVTDELLLESSKRFHVFKSKPVSPKIDNLNGNSNQNGTIFMEDTEEMAGMESPLSYQQPPIPRCPPPSYQQSIFSSYQLSSTAPINPQQSSPYQGCIHTSTQQVQQMAPAATENSQPDLQHQSNSSFPIGDTISPSTTAFPTPSTPASLPVNQFSTEVPVNLMRDTNANPDKMTMVKSFSKESGMNIEWAEKCLEENYWDYAKAVSCFSGLKANIPPIAFIH
ncbi:nuclear RNA export factor 1-like [Acyrthosiphon pisum]|uniref:Nuclear RNA export factor 1 n=1 Tax=Acyrthosiphon pisum TaxID=7029 RepID=A0A8R2H7Q3_ACYPI|nr:nuclear RNA export factor 1-like [Acyrthosiphon pisum]|eukprot:XP_016663786.1 PREDICTED: nuclear RNA export factor 1-like [Acyrthosiphon pisum]